MKEIRNLCWWAVFITAAIVIQAALPGVDVLAVGLLILLQERDYKNIFWLGPLFIFLQEGMGTRLFGGSVLLYVMTAVLFRLGQWWFEVKSFLFVVLLSTVLIGPYYALDWLMAPLQNMNFDMRGTLDKCLLQALFLPFAWRIFTLTRRWRKNNEAAE
ncbi:MAG: hypothetical protein LBC94_07640 [Desulfovibrio sp.]|jgi:hypothetical protein|nr:hypothetical protein [Desulfovibrio sp.]